MAREFTIYDDQQVIQRLGRELPSWEFKDGWIRRQYKTGGWPYTLMLVNAIGYIAEAAFHHPDLNVSWAEVRVKLMTHAAKGITDNDFELAKRIEATAIWLPDDSEALDGFEKGMKKKWIR